MKKNSICMVFMLVGNFALAQFAPIVIADSLYSATLENVGGEHPTRSMLVYLPPDYEENTDKRYPVIYYLHGFTSSDSINLEWFATDEKLRFAYEKHKIRPFILVVANQHTLYKGSWYINSSLTGNWGDFTARDLVSYIDATYRTIPDSGSRGICGWSMGGHGTIKMGMLYPDVFSCAYAMSPAVLTLCCDMPAAFAGFKDAQQAKGRSELLSKGFDATAVIALGRAFSPNPNKPPFFADLPFSYEGDSLVTHYGVLKKWYDNLPYDMLDSYAENFSKLKAFKIDWGRNEEFVYLPVTSRMFSKKLEALSINHYADEFIGRHGNNLWSYDGRMINDVLPFFDANLDFGDQ